MNKKQLIVTSILLSLMLILAITQGFFTKNFERINTVDNKVNEFTEYKFNLDKCCISFPKEWFVEEENSDGSYISYTLNFKEVDDNISGLVQVINTKEDIGVFADKDLKNQSLKYYDSKVKPYKNHEDVGVLAEYNTSIKDGYEFANECYYIKIDDGQIVKVLFNIRNDECTENIKNICTEIISSIKNHK